jgi:hypothetical protein
MTTICWTVIHHAAAPVAHGAAAVAQAARHMIGPVAHRATRLLHHAATAAVQPHTWVEVVCKLVPAAVLGGGLMAPHPVNPPQLPEPPPPIVEPAPPVSPWLFPPPSGPVTPVQPFPTPLPVEPTTGPVPIGPPSVGPVPPIESIPEPPSAGLLLGGAVCLLLVRLATRRTWPNAAGSPGGSQPGARQTHLVRCGPILRTLLGSHQHPVTAGEHQ